MQAEKREAAAKAKAKAKAENAAKALALKRARDALKKEKDAERKAAQQQKAEANKTAKEAEGKMKLMTKTISLLSGPITLLSLARTKLAASGSAEYTPTREMKIKAALMEAEAMYDAATKQAVDEFTWNAEEVTQVNRTQVSLHNSISKLCV